MSRRSQQSLDAELIYRDLAAQIRAAQIDAPLCLVGIHTGGVWVAQRLHEALGLSAPLGVVDVSFYRDDFAHSGLKPDVRPSRIDFEVGGSHIVLVDDVLYTGRTVRAAVNEIFDYGRPARVDLAVLVDRGGRELPISARFVGKTIALDAHTRVGLQRDEAGRFRFEFSPRDKE